MKIGIVLYPTYGGSGVVATELGKALAQKGHQIHFMSYNMPARLSRFIDNTFFHEVGVANYPLFDYPPYESALAGKIVDVVEFEQLDVLHVHYAIPHASAGFMAKQILKTKGFDVPMITTLHGTDITIVGRDASLKPVVEFSINQSEAVTAVSNNLKKQTVENFDIKNEITVVPNFIDIARFQVQSNVKAKIARANEQVILHISNFRSVKRVEDIIRAFHLIASETTSKLVLVGDGPERQKLENLCRELLICRQVLFLGKQDAIHELLSAADVFVMASERESFGLAALEAMAAGVPVISSNAGGLPELNIDGQTGQVFPVGDIQTLAAQLKQVLLNEQLLKQYSVNALERAKEFATERVIPQYELIYEQARKKFHSMKV